MRYHNSEEGDFVVLHIKLPFTDKNFSSMYDIHSAIEHLEAKIEEQIAELNVNLETLDDLIVVKRR